MEKRSRMGEESQYCKIDELPKDILINIIGKVSHVKEAARTSIVCQRWRNLWALSPYLNFEDHNIITGRRKSETDEYLEFVNHALDDHKGSSVESLRIALGVYAFLETRSEVKDSLCKWVEFAIRKRVQTLDLDLLENNHPFTHFFGEWVMPYRFPCSMLDHLEPRLSHPVFDRLKSMSLTSISLTDEELGRLLSTHLVNLEILSLRGIWELHKVQVTAPRLKQLMVRDCVNIQTFDLISAPNLQYFRHYLIIWDWEKHKRSIPPIVNLGFNSVPQLTSVCLGGPLCHNKSLIKLQRTGVEQLTLEMSSLCRDADHVECIEYPTRFPTLDRLKQLELKFLVGHQGCCMHNLVFIINACPCLEKLTLKYEMLDHDDDVVVGENNMLDQHPCLRVVEFIGWCGLESELQLANYLIHTSTNLRKLTFDTNPLNNQDRPWRAIHSMDEMKQPDVKAAESSAKLLTSRGHLICNWISASN